MNPIQPSSPLSLPPPPHHLVTDPYLSAHWFPVSLWVILWILPSRAPSYFHTWKNTNCTQMLTLAHSPTCAHSLSCMSYIMLVFTVMENRWASCLEKTYRQWVSASCKNHWIHTFFCLRLHCQVCLNAEESAECLVFNHRSTKRVTGKLFSVASFFRIRPSYQCR